MSLRKGPIAAVTTVAALAFLGSSAQAFGAQGTVSASVVGVGSEDPQYLAAQVAADAFDAYREAAPVDGYSSYAIRDGALVYYIAGGAKGSAADKLQSLREEYDVEIVVRDTPLGDRKDMLARFYDLGPALAEIPEYETMRPTSDRQGIEIGYEGELTDALRAKFDALLAGEFPALLLFRG